MSRVVAFFALLALAGLAVCQEVSTGLLRNAAVKQDLGLSAKTFQKMVEIWAKDGLWRVLHTPTEGGGGTPPTWAETKKRESETDAALLHLLSSHQRARLRQISLQAWGGPALLRPEVAERIGLSKSQRAKIERLGQSESRTLTKTMDRIIVESQRGEGGFGARAAHPLEVRRKLAELGVESDRRLLAAAIQVLNPAQRNAWTRMIGKAFPIEKLIDRF